MAEDTRSGCRHSASARKSSTIGSTSSKYQQLRVANKLKTTRSAFSTEEVILNGDGANSDATATTALATLSGTKSKKYTPLPRLNRAHRRDRRRGDKNSCLVFGEKSHPFYNCFRALGIEREVITQRARDTFASIMKVATFKKEIEEFRKGLAAAKAAADE